MQFRFVIGAPSAPRSAQWKLWPQGDDLYLLWRSLGAVQKFSFHKSGICRWALVKERPEGADRAVLKWKRGEVGEPGTRKGALLLSIVFPTNHLSSAHTELTTTTRAMRTITSAPEGMATQVDVFLTRESRAGVEQAFASIGQRTLQAFGPLRNSVNFGLASHHVECGPVDLRMPGKPRLPRQVFGDVVLPDVDHERTGRPLRLLLLSEPREGKPPVVWELGGSEPTLLPAHAAV